MGIEKIVADEKLKEYYEMQKETTSNSRKRSRRRQRKMPAVQKLYETCKEVFASGESGLVPPASDIERLKSILDTMTEKDVGLMPTMSYFRKATNDTVNKITYVPLHEGDKFTIAMFCLPPSGCIPLHNHPGMTVFSKLLFGTMHVRSYDWADDVPGSTSTELNNSDDHEDPELKLAKVKVNSDFTAPCNTSILYPADGGNMHCFTALTPCAVLDVLGPPYSDPEGRHCTYYDDFPFSSRSVDGVTVPEEEEKGYAWLQDREYPKDLKLVGGIYSGPKILKN